MLCAYGYLAVAILLNWRLWAGLRTMTSAGDPGQGDSDLFAWCMRYAADAVAHGHLPALVTQALNAPRGVNLMWNTSILLPALLLAPVTLVAGPHASLTILLTLGYAGSATAMYWLLRRYGASVLAGVIGGAVYGFSPALLDSGVSHYNLQLAVLPPLIIDAVLRIVCGKGRPLRTGAWLGVLVAAQLFTQEEVMVDTAIAGLVLIVVLVARYPHMVAPRLRETLAGLGTGAAVTLAVGGYGLWVQFAGPLTEHGSPFADKAANAAGAFVNPQPGLLFHTSSSAAYAAGHGLEYSEYLAYLGWPLLIVLVLAIVWFWRDVRVLAAGAIWVVLELLSLGGGSPLLPFHWLQGVPLLVEMIPDRLSILADGAAAAVLAFGLDLGRAAVSSPQAGRLRRVAPLVVAMVAVLPLLPRPAAAVTATPVPAGWDTVFARLHLPANESALVVPVPYNHEADAMLWQADTGQPAELNAGWFIGPLPDGRAVVGYYGPSSSQTHQAVACLDRLWDGTVPASQCTMVKAALAYWHPGAVVADTTRDSPLGRFLTELLGRPTIKAGQLLAWRTKA